MSKSAPRLGKGLNALIGPRVPEATQTPPAPNRSAVSQAMATSQAEANVLRQIPIDRIDPNPSQPRASIDEQSLQQLADSIRHSGVLQPILVRHADDHRFELVAGERRWRAARLAGLDAIPAIVRELTDAESFETALVENLQREDLNPIERATAYQQLVDLLGVSLDEVAARLGESRANISNYLRLLNLAQEVQHMVCQAELSMGHARAIAGVTNPQRQLAIARLAVRRNLSVRQVETLVQEPADREPRPLPAARPVDAHLADVERELSKALGLAVALQPGRKKNSGRIVIRYNSLEEFDRIAERVCGRPTME